MTTLPIETGMGPTLRGEAMFGAARELAQIGGSLAAAGLLVVNLDAPGPSARGRLREVIESAIETALERRGAAPPGVGASSDLDASLSDQLYRARHVGARGLALRIAPLEGAANLAGALDAEDSAVVRWWLAATAERPVVLLIDEANRTIGAYGPPAPLEKLLARASGPESETETDAEIVTPTATEPEPATPTATATATQTEPATETPTALATDPDPEPATLRIAVAAPAPPPTSATEPAPPLPEPSEWRAWAAELDAAKGPKPLAAIERLFVSRYVPLSDVVARGGGDAAARATLSSWGASFAKSYTEAFGALRVTGKRPMMVLDVPQLATRIARLHGAKSTQLVLVDAMRFDLGLRVHDRMRRALGGDAACTERLLLWSALPTTTPTQMDLLARGPDGLAGRGEPSEREEPIARGRGITTLRRVKVGPRDVLKLDVAEARLRETGPSIPARLDAIADEASAALVAHARALQPRTLLFVFGDHGFRLEPFEDGTGPAHHGGATPDEVLVPAFAWMIGGIH